MTYTVKEAYYTLQGEGAQTGRAAVFLRFAGCNLWNGLERDRESAVCRFCDTDFVGANGPGGGKFESAAALADHVTALWPAASDGVRYVVCTGGEPLLQLDATLVGALHAAGFEIGVETNGTQAAVPGLDWICVSPKAQAPLIQRTGDELKLVFPQDEPEAQPERFTSLAFNHFFLQPKDVPFNPDAARRHRDAAIAYCLKHPQWKLSLQTHKLTGLP
jgi:7-carboxy-7-deazaguanine synthase (Cx14CxxC type)